MEEINVHVKGGAMQFRFVYEEPSGSLFVSDIVLPKEEALAHLGMDRLLHVLSGWETEVCECGLGFEARRGRKVRRVHLEPELHSTNADVIEDLVGDILTLIGGRPYDRVDDGIVL